MILYRLQLGNERRLFACNRPAIFVESFATAATSCEKCRRRQRRLRQCAQQFRSHRCCMRCRFRRDLRRLQRQRKTFSQPRDRGLGLTRWNILTGDGDESRARWIGMGRRQAAAVSGQPVSACDGRVAARRAEEVATTTTRRRHLLQRPRQLRRRLQHLFGLFNEPIWCRTAQCRRQRRTRI